MRPFDDQTSLVSDNLDGVVLLFVCFPQYPCMAKDPFTYLCYLPNDPLRSIHMISHSDTVFGKMEKCQGSG